MLTCYAPAPLPRATNDLMAAAADDDHALTPKTGLALLKAHPAEVLRAAYAALPTAPDGLSEGDPWLNNGTLAFVPAT